ncbi:MAG: hypothetical protein AAGJ31_06680, partial [Verrucomicrobiota bacterium]
MAELLQESFQAHNFPATLLLILCLGYWIFVLIGTLDLDAFDLGGPEFDLDVDLDTEGGEGSSSGSEGHWFGALIRFFNLVEIPG